MASSVATPLEEQFGQIPGVTQMTSSSALGFTSITLQFDLSRDIEGAATDTLAAINAAGGQLPPAMIFPPTIRKVNPADTPILVLALTSDTLPLTTVDAYAENILLQKISQISGVGQVGIGGQQKPAMRVQVNPQALAARGIGLEDVRNVISQANVDLPKGTLNSPRQDLHHQHQRPVARPGRLQQSDRRLPQRLRRSASRTSATPSTVRKTTCWPHGPTSSAAILLAVQRQPGANVIATVDRVKAMLPQLQASIPKDIKVSILSDRTETIRASVSDVRFTLMLTVALVVMVIFLFLRNFWATVIPAVTVPLSLVGTFAALYELGYSLDNLSLMALTIAVGFVVDDAVVVIENIVRHLEEGLSPMQAAIKGSGEIGFTIVSITLSLIAVFIPLFLMGGYVGLLFREFAITVSVALVLSLVISLTLTPMMCSRLLKPETGQHGRLYRLFESGFEWLVDLYGRGLAIVLRHQFITLMVMLGTIVLTGYLYVVIPKGFFPQQDTGMIIGVTEAAQDISFEAMSERQQAVVNVVLEDPAVASVGSQIGAGGPTATLNDGRMFIALKPKDQRKASADEVINRLRPRLARLQGITLYMQAAQDITIGGRVARTQYQYHAHRSGSRRTQALVRAVPGQAEIGPGDRRRRQRPAECRTAARHHHQPRRRLELRHPAGDDRQHAVGRLRPAHRLLHPDPAEPVSRRAGGAAAIPVRPERDERHLPQLLERTAGAAHHPGHRHREGGAAGRQPSGPVSVDHHLLQPAAGHVDRQRGGRHSAGRQGTGQTGGAGDELPGQCSGVPVLAVEHADVDRGRPRRHLHHPGRAL